MRPGNGEYGSHVAMHTPRTPLHLGRPSRVQRYSSSMRRAMEEDSLMIRHEDDDRVIMWGTRDTQSGPTVMKSLNVHTELLILSTSCIPY